mmetsp:Transcript_98828/g.159331  ORF Transcript_98828/g.159331 Transcript_98828/m.159331 type:complete len:191 (+) Transcript_98828:169-741(+)|eukprot:CAMPEP_0179417072 /NCGR_PEP_ID=MMETSP0799-20121207/7153_1 /TAXON_ID=46947 /ORGANISM="Geminigera cryophila, Strain CCMP2564" /LENGTH=190 /DNA_ID=CAMNT_0021190019 /DNA_START=264 /DNA_END=836 /DNA_ORIENTATION=+
MGNIASTSTPEEKAFKKQCKKNTKLNREVVDLPDGQLTPADLVPTPTSVRKVEGMTRSCSFNYQVAEATYHPEETDFQDVTHEGLIYPAEDEEEHIVHLVPSSVPVVASEQSHRAAYLPGDESPSSPMHLTLASTRSSPLSDDTEDLPSRPQRPLDVSGRTKSKSILRKSNSEEALSSSSNHSILLPSPC